MFWKKKPAIYPYENYFVPGPNPAPGLTTAEYKDPYREHAPIATEKPWWWSPGASADPAIQRIGPDFAILPTKEVPPLLVEIPAGGYITPEIEMQRGWHQAFVPDQGRRTALQAQTPLLQLSAPIHSANKSASISGARRKITKLRAPKARDL